jgi:preprotein translocase subunit YajC
MLHAPTLQHPCLLADQILASLVPAQPGNNAADSSVHQLSGQADPGSSAPISGTQGQPSGATTSSSNMSTILLIPLALVAVMIITQVMSGKKDKKRRVQLLSTLKRHDRVQTIGGIIGTVVEVRDEDVLLKVDEGSNTRIRFAKSAVQQVLRSADGGGSSDGASALEAKPKSEKATV